MLLPLWVAMDREDVARTAGEGLETEGLVVLSERERREERSEEAMV